MGTPDTPPSPKWLRDRRWGHRVKLPQDNQAHATVTVLDEDPFFGIEERVRMIRSKRPTEEEYAWLTGFAD